MEAQHFEIPSNVNSPVATANFHSARTPGHFLLYGMSLFTHFVHQKPFSCTNCRFSPGLYTTGLPPVQNTGSTLRLSEVFLIRHIRNKIALPDTLQSLCVTSGNGKSKIMGYFRFWGLKTEVKEYFSRIYNKGIQRDNRTFEIHRATR